ncbi:hypothetical protein evm_009712 [Chilo suppressalis]|nr:hypothetical protein evm_009712 [Chilo suppressalis]
MHKSHKSFLRIMASKVILFFIIAVTAERASSLEGDTVAEAVNNTDLVNMQWGICLKCICNDDKVDCSKQELTKYFSKDEWAALKDFKPRTIDMSYNSFENITVMAELPIEVLNLSRCGIQSIESHAFLSLQNLKVLDLSHNKLTSSYGPQVDGYTRPRYKPLMSIEVLNLAYNDLHSFNLDLFNQITHPTELDLSGNPMSNTNDDDDKFVEERWARGTKILHLRSCHLEAINRLFLFSFGSVTRLDLSDNLLTVVPDGLGELRGLLYLNLNQNPIRALVRDPMRPGYPYLTKLKELHMCNMPNLTEIGDGAMASLRSLEKLHLSFNPQLRRISRTALVRHTGQDHESPMVKEVSLKLFSYTSLCSEPEEMRGITMRHLYENNRIKRCGEEQRPERHVFVPGGAMLTSISELLLVCCLLFPLWWL